MGFREIGFAGGRVLKVLLFEQVLCNIFVFSVCMRLFGSERTSDTSVSDANMCKCNFHFQLLKFAYNPDEILCI